MTKTLTPMNQKCLVCETPFSGRKDKKFCSDLCRNTYNNQQNSDGVNLVRNTNNALRKNRRILAKICPAEKAKTRRNTLLDKGFDFNLITSVRTTKKGSTYYFVYDYGYLELDNDFFLVVKDNRTES